MTPTNRIGTRADRVLLAVRALEAIASFHAIATS
jgi:hypothetical protein